MKKFDIEAYLDGSLSGDELTAFQHEMRENPVFAQQVEQQRNISRHLRTQLLREHVATVLKEKPQTSLFRKWWLIGGALSILLAVYLLVFKNASPNGPLPKETQQEAQPVAPTIPAPEKMPDEPVLEQDNTPRSPEPIAAKRPSDLDTPQYPAPNIRGQQEENTAWKKTLDQLWYTKFPPPNARFNQPFSAPAQWLIDRDFPTAFVALETLELQQHANDTLRLLKAYCLLEMGEGAEALRYFDQLEVRQRQWKSYLQWHRTLCLLAIGEQKKALPELRKMADSPSHPFRQQSLRALKVLK